jgi:hypothetical protein
MTLDIPWQWNIHRLAWAAPGCPPGILWSKLALEFDPGRCNEMAARPRRISVCQLFDFSFV